MRPPRADTAFTGAIRRQRQTAAHWFRMGREWPRLFWPGLGMTLLLWCSSIQLLKKNWFLLSAPCQRHKKEGEPTGLIYGPLVNDDTPSTPFRAVPVHDTSISINSLYPSEGSQSPPGSPTWLLQNNWLFFLFNFCSSTIFFIFVVDVVVLLVVVAPLFNLIPFFYPNFPQSTGLRRPSESSWAKITSGYSSAWCHSVGANTIRCHFFPSVSASGK